MVKKKKEDERAKKDEGGDGERPKRKGGVKKKNSGGGDVEGPIGEAYECNPKEFVWAPPDIGEKGLTLSYIGYATQILRNVKNIEEAEKVLKQFSGIKGKARTKVQEFRSKCKTALNEILIGVRDDGLKKIRKTLSQTDFSEVQKEFHKYSGTKFSAPSKLPSIWSISVACLLAVQGEDELEDDYISPQLRENKELNIEWIIGADQWKLRIYEHPQVDERDEIPDGAGRSETEMDEAETEVFNKITDVVSKEKRIFPKLKFLEIEHGERALTYQDRHKTNTLCTWCEKLRPGKEILQMNQRGQGLVCDICLLIKQKIPSQEKKKIAIEEKKRREEQKIKEKKDIGEQNMKLKEEKKAITRKNGGRKKVKESDHENTNVDAETKEGRANEVVPEHDGDVTSAMEKDDNKDGIERKKIQMKNMGKGEDKEENNGEGDFRRTAGGDATGLRPTRPVKEAVRGLETMPMQATDSKRENVSFKEISETDNKQEVEVIEQDMGGENWTEEGVEIEIGEDPHEEKQEKGFYERIDAIHEGLHKIDESNRRWKENEEEHLSKANAEKIIVKEMENIERIKFEKNNSKIDRAWETNEGHVVVLTEKGTTYFKKMNKKQGTWNHMSEKMRPEEIEIAREIQKYGNTRKEIKEEWERIFDADGIRNEEKTRIYWEKIKQDNEIRKICRDNIIDDEKLLQILEQIDIEIFTDGSGATHKDQQIQSKRGGWGFWAIEAHTTGERIMRRWISRGGITRGRGTNMLGELEAIKETLKYLIESAHKQESDGAKKDEEEHFYIGSPEGKGKKQDKRRVVIRFDSVIAMTLTTGEDHSKKQDVEEIANEAKAFLVEASEHYEIYWLHVKGHSDNEGNDHADRNAEEGKMGNFEKEGRLIRRWTTCDQRTDCLEKYLGKNKHEREREIDMEQKEEEKKVEGYQNLSSGQDGKESEGKENHEKEGDMRKKKEPSDTQRNTNEERKERYKEKNRGCNKATWNPNGIIGKEWFIEEMIQEEDLSFVVITEPKISTSAWRAKSNGVEGGFESWQICGKSRKGEGGGVWIIARDRVRFEPIIYDGSETNKEAKGFEDQEITTAMIQEENSLEWVLAVGVYVTNNKKKKEREATLFGLEGAINETKKEAEKRGYKVKEIAVLGDLNMRLTKKERRTIEFGGDEDGDSEEEEEQEEWPTEIKWQDATVLGTYTKKEKIYVRNWLNHLGLKIVNGREPYDKGVPTHVAWTRQENLKNEDGNEEPLEGISILDYIMTSRITDIKEMKVVEPIGIRGCEQEGERRISDHNMVIAKVKEKLPKPMMKREKKEEGKTEIDEIKQVKWEKWGEVEMRRYNDIIQGQIADAEERWRDDNTGTEDICKEQQAIDYAIHIAAVETENERLARQKGEDHNGELRKDKEYQRLAGLKAGWIEALRTHEKEMTTETYERLMEKKKEWRKALREKDTKSKGQNTEWWRFVYKTSQQRFWKELQALDKPKTKKDAAEADRIMINGKTTTTDDETVKEQTKYTATLEVMDYNEELGIELTQEDKEYPMKMNCFQEWKEQVIETKWKEEDKKGERSIYNEICNDGILESEWQQGLEKGKKKKAAGADEIPNEAFIVLDRINQRKVMQLWAEIYEKETQPNDWANAEKRYLDKKQKSIDIDDKRGISLLSIHGKKFNGAVTKRLEVILNNNAARTQGATKGVGCVAQAMGLAQAIANRYERGERTYAALIDLKKAFDTMKHSIMRSTLQQRKVRGKLLRATMAKYRRRKVRIKIRGENGKTIRGRWYKGSDIGVTQGGIDSMQLFTGCISDLEDALAREGIRGVKIVRKGEGGNQQGGQDGRRMRNLDFADDIIILAEDEEDMRQALKVIERYYIRKRLTPNAGKCEIIIFDPKKRALRENFKMNGKDIKQKKEVVYLGFTLSEDCKWSAHIKKRTKKASTWRRKATQISRKHGSAPIGAEKLIRNGGEKASGLYGAETWTGLYGKRYDDLEAKQARIERSMLGLGPRQELWMAHQEMQTESWTNEKFYLKMKTILTARKNQDITVRDIFEARTSQWDDEKKNGIIEEDKKYCEYDIIGRALNDIWKMEKETGQYGALEKTINNTCTETALKEIKALLDAMEKKRTQEKKERSKRQLERKGFKEWKGEWDEARMDIPTCEISWIAKARTIGLETEFELGRRKGTEKEMRVCTCGKAIGTCAHVIEYCQEHDEDRTRTKTRLRDLGMKNTNIWDFIKEAGGREGHNVEKKTKALREINAFIGRIFAKKKDRGIYGMSRDKVEELEEGREMMRNLLTKQGWKLGEKNRKKGHGKKEANSKVEGYAQEKTMVQKINVRKLERELTKQGVWNEKEKMKIRKIIEATIEEKLPVVYRRKEERGRWYAKGMAQLQSCQKTIREVALSGQGYSADIEVSFPTIVIAISDTIKEETGREVDLEEMRQMVKNKKKWREEAAKELKTNIGKVKKAVNAMLFGMELKKWKRVNGVREENRSAKLEKFEKEVKKIRFEIVRRERDKGRYGYEIKDTTILSKQVEEVEQQIIEHVIGRLEKEKWMVTTLIHDEIIIEPNNICEDPGEELKDIRKIIMQGLRDFEHEKKWENNLIKMEVAKMN